MKSFSTFTGLLLVLQGLLCTCFASDDSFRLLSGTRWWPEVLAIGVASLGLLIRCYGFKIVGQTITTARFFFFTPKEKHDFRMYTLVLHTWISNLYITAGLLCAFGSVVMLYRLDTHPIFLASSLFLAIAPMIWGFLVAEVVLRPLTYRLDALSHQGAMKCESVALPPKDEWLNLRIAYGGLLFATSVVLACLLCVYEDNKIPEDLQRMDRADPTVDLKMNLQRGDLRFRGVRGYGISVPGISGRDINARIVDPYGIYIIEGTSDCARTTEQQRLGENAWEYVKAYNGLLLKYFESVKWPGTSCETMADRMVQDSIAQMEKAKGDTWDIEMKQTLFRNLAAGLTLVEKGDHIMYWARFDCFDNGRVKGGWVERDWDLVVYTDGKKAFVKKLKTGSPIPPDAAEEAQQIDE